MSDDQSSSCAEGTETTNRMETEREGDRTGSWEACVERADTFLGDKTHLLKLLRGGALLRGLKQRDDDVDP